MEVLKTEYFIVTHDQEKETLYCEWNSKSFYMHEEEFKTILLDVVELTKQDNANYLYCDNREFLFTMNDVFQRWHDENVAFPFSVNMKKMAFVQSPDFFAQIAVEQIFDEDNGRKMPVQHFENTEEAKAWLSNN